MTTAIQKRTELIPDEVELALSGRDLTAKPSSTARAVYGLVVGRGDSLGKQVAAQATRHVERLAEWASFVRELFAQLYDADGCRELPEEERSAWGMQAVGVLHSSQEWTALVASSQVSRSIASQATALLADEVSRALELDSLKKDQEAAQDPREIAEGLERSSALLAEHGATEEQVKEHRQQVEAQLAKAVDTRRRMDERINKVRVQISGSVKRVAAAAKTKADAVMALVALGFSREGPGSAEEDCPELLEAMRLDPRMAAIIRMAGRMNEAARGELAKADGQCDVVGVRPTGDIAKLTARTKADLASGGVRGLATMRDIAEQAAQGWEQKDRRPKNKGDAALLVDRSGSMSGEREVRARGLAVASLVSMLSAGRRVVAGSFAGSGDCSLAAVVPGDRKALSRAVSALCKRASGGTDVDSALLAAAKEMQTFPGGMRQPDVLVVTDGEFETIRSEVLQVLGERRLFGVLIDVFAPGGHEEFDRIWSLPSVQEQDAAQVIAAMRSAR